MLLLGVEDGVQQYKMEVGDSFTYILPSGRKIQLDVTQDFATVYVVSKVDNGEYSLFKEQNCQNAENWTVISPNGLIPLL